MGAGASEAAAALAAISSRDPGFDVESFLSQATEVFLAVRRGRSTGDVDGLRVSVADTAWTALGLDQPADGRDALPDLAEPEVLRASTGAMDSITLRFSATDGRGREVLDWTFQRPGTARTQNRGTECPHCGARGSYGHDGRCTYCHQAMTPDSWQVTRATSAAAGDVPVADREDLVRAVTAALEAQGEHRSTSAPVRHRSGCLLGTVFRVLVLVAIVAAGVAAYGWLVPDSPVHPTVVKLIPAAKRAKLHGAITLNGEVAGEAPFDVWWSSPVSCADLSTKTSTISLSGSLPGGATTKVDIRTTAIDLATPLTGTITAVVNYDDTAGNVHQVWQNATGFGALGTASIIVTGDGSGQAAFADLPPGLTTPGAPQAPLAGSIAWTCADE